MTAIHASLLAAKSCHEAVHSFLAADFDHTLDGIACRAQSQPIPNFYTSALHRETQAQVRHTLRLYEQMLSEYPLENLAISYNGGKDCLVMLVLYLAAVYARAQKLGTAQVLLNAVYINNEPTFPEQDTFLETSSKDFALDLLPFNTTMKHGLEQYLEMKPEIKAIIVGIRRIDPYGSRVGVSQRTDNGWPDFVRLHPVLEWSTCEVWYFLKALGTPYCSLYDQGYTSLGGVDTTIPNPLLLQDDGTYLPAYILHDDNNERLSRVSDTKVGGIDKKAG